MEDWMKQVDSGADAYGGLPFWSWNDKLDEKELRRQMNVMRGLGMKGFFMHARGGLETEYLGDDWYSCIKACVEEAEKLGMEAWAYDENGWPSGFAGGKVLENPQNYATFLRMEEADSFPEIRETVPPERRVLAVYRQENGGFRRVEAPESGAERYYVIYQNFDSSYVDTMDARVTREFISYTHEEYKKKIEKGFGTVLPGFFTDEPQYYRYATTWSNTIPAEFEKAYGYSVFENLPALFTDYEGADEFRYDYWSLCHRLFIQNFAGVVYDWCEKNGCRITGHAIEETALFTQMWCCGGVMPFYEYEHIPGIDYLSRGILSDIAGKQVGSVAAQLGKKKVLSEMFACCGWDVTPRELKKIAELQYASGVNVMCHHLYAYSIRGQRKRDYPANYSEHLPWQPVLADFVQYFNRLGYLLSRGQEAVKTLILHPIHSAYLTYKREVDRPSIQEIEDGFGKITSYFSDRQIPFHYGDETIMARHASVKGRKLAVGLCEYEYVVLPKTYTLDASTAALLKEYTENGGRVLLFDGAPDRIDGRKADLGWLHSNVTVEEIQEASAARLSLPEGGDGIRGIKQMTRETDFGTLFFFVNVGERDFDKVKIAFKDCALLQEIFLEEAEWKTEPVKTAATVTENGRAVHVTSFENGKSRLFLIPKNVPETKEKGAEEAPQPACAEKPIVLGGQYRFTEKPQNALTLDYAALSYDGVQFTEPLPIIAVFDRLLQERYRGDVYLRFSFRVDGKPASLHAAVEPMRYKSLSVNGKPLVLTDEWWLDRSFRCADILPYVKTGENCIEMSFDYYQRDYVYYVLYGGVSESLRNCLAFDTEVESMYLFGDFAVRTDPEAFTPSERRSWCYTGDFAIVPSKETVQAGNVVTDGYPFFAGRLSVEQTFESDREDGSLWLDGRFAYADVYLNGAFVKRLMFTNHCELGGFLKKGTNTLRLVLCNSNRNLLGPHHFADPEPYACGPTTFSLEKMWQDGKCSSFADRYAFVRFGIDASIR